MSDIAHNEIKHGVALSDQTHVDQAGHCRHHPDHHQHESHEGREDAAVGDQREADRHAGNSSQGRSEEVDNGHVTTPCTRGLCKRAATVRRDESERFSRQVLAVMENFRDVRKNPRRGPLLSGLEAVTLRATPSAAAATASAAAQSIVPTRLRLQPACAPRRRSCAGAPINVAMHLEVNGIAHNSKQHGS